MFLSHLTHKKFNSKSQDTNQGFSQGGKGDIFFIDKNSIQKPQKNHRKEIFWQNFENLRCEIILEEYVQEKKNAHMKKKKKGWATANQQLWKLFGEKQFFLAKIFFKFNKNIKNK